MVIIVGIAALIRWRPSVTPPMIALLLIGVPANLRAIDTFTARQQQPTALYRATVLALPRSPGSRVVPPTLEPIPGITIGWLLAGADSGRIPDPGTISPVQAAMDKIRLSFQLARSSGGASGPAAPSSPP